MKLEFGAHESLVAPAIIAEAIQVTSVKASEETDFDTFHTAVISTL